VRYTFTMRGGDGNWRERPGCALVRVNAGEIAEWREYAG
jgi:hypothetical protein